MKKIFLLLLILLFISNVFSNDLILPLTIKTTPEKVEVYLNDTLQGYTPITISNLLKGVYLLSLQKENYETQTFFIDLTDENTTELDITMKSVINPDKEITINTKTNEKKQINEKQLLVPINFNSADINIQDLLISQLRFGINPKINTIYPLQFPIGVSFYYAPLKNFEAMLNTDLSIKMNDTITVNDDIDYNFSFGCKFLDKASNFNYGASLIYKLNILNFIQSSINNNIYLTALSGVNYFNFSTFLSIAFINRISLLESNYSFLIQLQERYQNNDFSILYSFNYEYPDCFINQLELNFCPRKLPFAYRIEASINYSSHAFNNYSIIFSVLPYFHF